MASSARAADNVKQPGLAGSWYPAEKAVLSRMLDGFLFDVALPEDLPPAADVDVIISPHAGYVFSGPVAAHGFRAVQGRKVSTVIILAPTHHHSFQGASVWPDGAFATPLGMAAVDAALAARIMAQDRVFSFRRDVFEGKPGQAENSIETQLPFIQKVFPEAKIVPVVMGFPPDPDVIKAVASALARAVGGRDDVLVAVSVDQSHFHPLKEAMAIDEQGLAAIRKFDIDGLWQGHMDSRMEVDGFHVVMAAMLYAQERGAGHARVLKYATSADATGDAARVVGYASAVFFRPPRPAFSSGVLPLTQAHKDRLVKIARTTLDLFVRTGKALGVDEKDPRLLEPEGAFVTLTKNGALRGCIGNIIADGPLAVTVRDMAVAAASQDPRFDAVRPGELADIHVEVSVLSRPWVVKSADEIVMGKHGVIVRQGGRGGVFLPQVATETGWTKERFLSELCSQKAGLSPDCWKDPAVRLEVFTAEVFGE